MIDAGVRGPSALRGFGPAGVVAIVVVMAGNFVFAPLSAALVLLWALRSRTPWPALGYGGSRNLVVEVVSGVALGVALKLVAKAVLLPLVGAPPENAAFQFLRGDPSAVLRMALVVVVVAGWGEETLYRGFLFERLRAALGTGSWQILVIVMVTSAWFGLAHFPEQGWAGVTQSLALGLALGSIYAGLGRLWLPIAAHAAFDLTALALIYLEWEIPVSRFVFG